MGIGEQLTSDIYAKHQRQLTNRYREQNTIIRGLAFLSPYLSIRELSMGLSGTDFETYDDYLLQAEDYRYKMAMHMAKLQKEQLKPSAIHSSEGKKNAIDRSEFHRFPEFQYHYQPALRSLRQQATPLVALLIMLGLCLGITYKANELFPISK